MARLTLAQIHQLLQQQSITDREPWCSGNEELIEKLYASACSDIEKETKVIAIIEDGHYGSGYASFIAAHFNLPTPEFEQQDLRPPEIDVQVNVGVLFSRFCHYFVLMGRSKPNRFPNFSQVDDFVLPGEVKFSKTIQSILERNGLIRLFREDVAAKLPNDIEVDTFLADSSGFREFDALFYWSD